MKMIIIYPWMLKRFKGVELLIFAVIYSFHAYKRTTLMLLNTWLSLLNCSRSQFYESIKSLLNKNVIAGSLSLGFYLVDDICSVSDEIEDITNAEWNALLADIED